MYETDEWQKKQIQNYFNKLELHDFLVDQSQSLSPSGKHLKVQP
jgi:hypothetical protein